jgi:hypothetical protein
VIVMCRACLFMKCGTEEYNSICTCCKDGHILAKGRGDVLGMYAEPMRSGSEGQELPVLPRQSRKILSDQRVPVVADLDGERIVVGSSETTVDGFVIIELHNSKIIKLFHSDDIKALELGWSNEESA